MESLIIFFPNNRQDTPDVVVHLDNLACQTGASRFTQLEDSWTYDKTEGLSLASRLANPRYTHLVLEPPSEEDAEAATELLKNFQVVATVTQTAGVSVDLKSFPPVRFRRKTALLVLERISR